MLAMFEKLINEHGSSAILKERIQLISDKYSMLEEKNKHLEERNSFLEEALTSAKDTISELQAIIDSAQAIQELPVLDEVELKILKRLFETNEDERADDMALYLSIPVGNVEYHLDKLLENEMVHDHLNMMSGTSYSINSKGRAYIIEQKI